MLPFLYYGCCSVLFLNIKFSCNLVVESKFIFLFYDRGPPSAGPPLAGLAALGLGPPTQKDWDQLSMYSQRTDRSVPRARMYHMERAGQSRKMNQILHAAPFLSF